MEIGSIVVYVVLGLVALSVLIAFISAAFTVGEKKAAIVTRFSQFHKVAPAGLNFKVPFIDAVAKRMSLAVLRADIPIDLLTSDNKPLRVTVTVNYEVCVDRIRDAYYKLASPESQIEAFVCTTLQAHIKSLTLDHVFTEKDSIAARVSTDLDKVMEEFGYRIVKTLLSKIEPHKEVIEAMAQAAAAQQQRLATEQVAEGKKRASILAAEAERETMKLIGEGIAAQREAIAEGAKEAFEKLRAAMPEADPNTIIMINALSMYVDMMKEVSAKSGSQLVFLNGAPGGLQDMMQQLMSTLQMRPPAAGANGTTKSVAAAAKTATT